MEENIKNNFDESLESNDKVLKNNSIHNLNEAIKVNEVEKTITTNNNNKENEEIIDFGKLKNKTINFFKNLTHTNKNNLKKKETLPGDNEENFSLDFDKVKDFTKKNSKWLIPLALILIVVIFSTYFRIMPAYLPITNDWAENTVYNYYHTQIESQINQQYPNLPTQNRQALVEKEFEKQLQENTDQIDAQIDQIAQQYKSHMQDESGQTYLLAIDPYLTYGYANNYLTYGQWGNTIKDGKSWYSLRNGREGQAASFQLLPFLNVISYKFMNIFTNASLMKGVFYLPIFMIGLASIAMFFIGKKVSNNFGGLVAGIIFGIHNVLLSRTTGGFTDTDNVVALFEVLTIALFIFAFEAKENRNKWIFSTLAGLSMSVYLLGHQSWWHIFDFIIGSIIVYNVYLLFIAKSIKNYIKNKYYDTLLTTGKFILSTIIFGTLFRGITGGNYFYYFKRIILAPFVDPLEFIVAKKVAVTSIWPNVLTTVAELNNASLTTIINNLGGTLLFVISIIGIVYLIVKKENRSHKNLFYAFLFSFWYLAAIYASFSGLRFIALLVPPFALLLGIFSGGIYQSIIPWAKKNLHINPNITRTMVIFIIFLVIILPLLTTANNIGKNEIPGMNDAWYNSLIKIKDNTSEAMITSWWDFGHWFVAIAQRQVTFDGGDHDERIYWVGKTLLTSDENTSVGLLRLLNCNQGKVAHVLEGYLNNDTVKSIEIANKIMATNDKEIAIKILKNENFDQDQIDNLIKLSYCDNLIEQFYITSEDMVGKAGVWGHFGSWDFKRAEMYNLVSKNKSNGVEILIDKFGLNQEQAEKYYLEITSTDADMWISSWPNYLSNLNSCVKENENYVNCYGTIQNNNIEFKINLNDKDVIIGKNNNLKPTAIVYNTNNSIEEKKFEGTTTGFSIILIEKEDGSYQFILADPLQAKSMFTKLFFYDGLGLKCFEKFNDVNTFSGQRIITWKVNFDCQ